MGTAPTPTPSANTPGPHAGPTAGPDATGTPQDPTVPLKGKTAVFEAMSGNAAVKALADLATDAKFDRKELTITVAKESIIAACEAVKAAGYNFFEDVDSGGLVPAGASVSAFVPHSFAQPEAADSAGSAVGFC